MVERPRKGITVQPIIAERRLLRNGDNAPVDIQIHQPERDAASSDEWRCGHAIIGLPSLPRFYSPEHNLASGEVWFTYGADSLDALRLAFGNVRALIDRVEEEQGTSFVWPMRPDWGHMMPYWVEQEYGREVERRLQKRLEEEVVRLTNERVPNPYSWDDPRHPSQVARNFRKKREG